MPRPRRTSLQASSNATRKSSRAGNAPAGRSGEPPVEPPPAQEVRQPAYDQAVRLYEQGLEALQRHDFATAAELLRRVIAGYPDERELLDRARVYLKICERQTRPVAPAPQTASERVYAATLELNAGRPEAALAYLRSVVAEQPDHDHALYMLAVACAQRQDLSAALDHLKRAVALNPDNRPLARTDPDLDALRDTPEFQALLEAGAPQPKRRPRARPGR